MRVTALLAIVSALAIASPGTAVPAPQILDPANDANGGVYWAGNPDTPTVVGSQPYADVRSVRFATTKAVRTVAGQRRTVVTGFTVAMTLSDAPAPPYDMVAVYRVLAMAPGCLVGIDHYTAAPAGHPRTAVQDWCDGPAIRRTALAGAKVSGSTITWTVPLSALPRKAKVAAGVTLTDLHFETLLRPRGAACAGDAATPAEEQPPCAFTLDGTFARSATYVLR